MSEEGGGMKIISFAWTTEALMKGLKTATRRNWKDSYARRFHKGDFCQAYNKSPRNGGRCKGIIYLPQDLYKEPLAAMTDEEEKAEGGLWGSAEAYIDAYCEGAGVSLYHELWVIRFQLVEVYPNKSPFD